MSSPLVAGRATGFDIRAAGADHATLIERLSVAHSDPTAHAPEIWLSEGLSNAWMITTGQHRVIINTGMGFEAPVHKALFDAVDDSPVSHIILTQGHVDHVGGVDRFLDDDTEIVAQRNNPTCQDDDARIHAFRVRRSLPYWADAVSAAHTYISRHAGDEIPAQSIPVPSITFNDKLDLIVDSLRLELLSVPGGETIDSLAVWLPAHGVAFVGNLFSALFGHVPNLVTVRGDRYRFVDPFLSSLDRVRALNPRLLLTGHFQPIEGRDEIRAELDRIEAGVLWLHEAVIDGMNSGRSLTDLQQNLTIPAECSLGEGYGKTSWAVRAIWEGYAGWFKAESTTELYPSTPADVYPDLIELLGGPTLLAAHSRARTNEGDPVRGIHLAEMALGDGDNPEGLDAQIHAHEALLQDVDGQNFWETGWLRTQLIDLRARRARLDP